MSIAVRFINSTKKLKSKNFYFYALLLICISSLGLAGCSGLVTANNTTPPPALTISGVQAATPTTTGFQVSWSTSRAANSAVDYGTTASYGSSTATTSSMVMSHQVAVTGLRAGTLYHFRVRSTDAGNVSASGSDMTFTTAGGTTPPTVSITAPAVNATVSGVVTVSASATDNVGIASVQFKVDSTNTGAAITAAPYNYSLNTTAFSNGNHVLTALATDTAGNAATSAGVTVKVNNTSTTVPSITSLNPTSGPVGTSVTIAGANFGASQGSSSVAFNGVAATATAWSATSITVPVPNGATTGNVVVTVGGVASNGVNFTVPTVAPSISSLNPTSGFVGASVTITGANFGATQGSSTVKFNGTAATATSWSATTITAAVPAGATTGNVVVTVGGAVSNGVGFTVQADTTPPTVPAGLTATAISSSQINLAWTASTDNVGVTGYNVYRGGTKIGTAPSTSYQDAGLAASTSYTYNVSAFDAAGNTSAQSAAASATTQAASGGGGIPPALGWYQIPNTSIRSLCPPYSEIQGNSGCGAVMGAWSSGFFDTKRNRLIIHGGGHTDYYGNEIYAIDLNANPIAPVLVKDASHGSAVSNVTSCPEAFLDGTPNSRHSYNGEFYVAQMDVYLTYSGSKSTCGSFSNGMWYFDPGTLAWTQQTISGAAPNPAQNGSVAQLAYDPTSGDLFEVEANTGSFWKYDPAAKAWTNLAGVAGCNALNATAAIDNGRRLYFCVGNGSFHKISLAAPYTSTALTGTGCGNLKSINGPGFAYDPVQKLMIGWGGGDTVYLYNPDTDACTAVTYTGGPTVIQANGTYSRFTYAPALGVFVVANSIDTNAYSLRLTQPTSGGAMQDFQTRCAQPGVIVCEGFDSASTFVHSGGNLHPSSGNSSVFMTQDFTTARSGSSMKCVVPAKTGPDACGSFYQHFGQTFGQNSTFYVQFAQKIDANVLNQHPMDSTGGQTFFKQAIIASAEGGTCASKELTTVNLYNRGYPYMYSQCGADGLETAIPGTFDILKEQGDQSKDLGDPVDSGYNCHYQTQNNGPNSCATYPADVWVTYYYKIQIGTWGTASSNIYAFRALPGQGYVEWVKQVNHKLLNTEAGNGYNIIDLLNYYTARDGGVAYGQTGATWYDELIISTQPIAAPVALPALP